MRSSASVSGNLAVARAAEGKLTLRIAADSASSRRYFLAGDTTAIALAELTNRLVAARRDAPGESTLSIYTYPGAFGYDVVMAMNAAQTAGLTRVEGVADFSDDDGILARRQWKHWSSDLPAAEGERSVQPDTLTSRKG